MFELAGQRRRELGAEPAIQILHRVGSGTLGAAFPAEIGNDRGNVPCVDHLHQEELIPPVASDEDAVADVDVKLGLGLTERDVE
jgi:hypothetical protein